MNYYLFVYGTLRRGFKNEAAQRLHQQAIYCGVAKLRAKLYEVNGYPGVVLSDDAADQVIGEVFQLSHEAANDDLIRLIDRYEGISEDIKTVDEYRKEAVTVSLLESSIEVEALTYLYQHATENLEIIGSGDFLIGSSEDSQTLSTDY